MQTILVLPNVADNQEIKVKKVQDNQEIKVKKVQEVEKVIEVRNLKS
jgi:hypothetical protein